MPGGSAGGRKIKPAVFPLIFYLPEERHWKPDGQPDGPSSFDFAARFQAWACANARRNPTRNATRIRGTR